MRKLGAKWVFAGLAEVVEPRHTTVVVVDMQNHYCNHKGTTKDLSLIRASLQPQASLIRKAREIGAMVIFTKTTTDAGHATDSPCHLYRKILYQKVLATTRRPVGGVAQFMPEFIIEDSWGHQVVDQLKELAPEAAEVRKNRAGAFVNTNLDLLLRSNHIQTIVVTGCVTESCVASTALDALAHDYYCVVVRDCVGSHSRGRHEAALKVLGSLLDVVDSGEILGIWNKFEAQSTPR